MKSKKTQVDGKKNGRKLSMVERIEKSGPYDNSTHVLKKLYPKSWDSMADSLCDLYTEITADMEGGGIQLISEVAAYIAWKRSLGNDLKALSHMVFNFKCEDAQAMAAACLTVWPRAVLDAIDEAAKAKIAWLKEPMANSNRKLRKDLAENLAAVFQS